MARQKDSAKLIPKSIAVIYYIKVWIEAGTQQHPQGFLCASAPKHRRRTALLRCTGRRVSATRVVGTRLFFFEGGGTSSGSTVNRVELRSLSYLRKIARLSFLFCKTWIALTSCRRERGLVLTTQVPAGTTFSALTISGTAGVGSCTAPAVGATVPTNYCPHSQCTRTGYLVSVWGSVRGEASCRRIPIALVDPLPGLF